ncbi:MAG TPA: efflux transporter outer membrane subunit [Rhodocyclaceae bacterium]|nr:efflux transporter outer membrane subunit [Rhodocyclaceae bacterium]
MNKNLPRLLLRAGLFALLGGCATHSDIATTAHLRDADSFGALPVAANANAQKPNQDFWKQLGDPQLDALIAEALADSPTLNVADARMRRAAAMIDVARSALMPDVNASFDSTAQRFSEKYIYPPPFAGSYRTDNRLALNAGWNLDLWGKDRSALKSAEAQRNLLQVESRAARIALSTSIGRAWVELDREFKQRDQIDAMIATRSELENLQAIRVKAGLDAEFDRFSQRQNLASLRVERAQMDERIDLQRNMISALLGKGPERSASLPQPKLNPQVEAGLPSVLPSDLLANRPDVLISRWRVEAALRDVDVARADFYPTVNLKAFLGFQSIGIDNLLDPKARILGIGSAIRLPIFEAGRLRADLAGKTADYDAAVDQYNATLIDALHDVSDQARSLDGAQHEAEEAAQGVAAAQHSVMLVEQRIKERLSSRIQLLTAQAQVLILQRAELDLRARRLDAALALERALGGGFSPDVNPFTLAAIK